MSIITVTPTAAGSFTSGPRVVVLVAPNPAPPPLVLGPAERVSRLTSNQWLVTLGAEPLLLTFAPERGETFPPGARARVRIVSERSSTKGADLPGVDLGGLAIATFAQVAHLGDTVTVTVEESGEDDYSPTAKSAIAKARRILGVERVGTAVIAVEVDVDGSYSMKPLAAPGGVLDQLVEIVFGVGRVIDDDRIVPVRVLVDEGELLMGAHFAAEPSMGSSTSRPGALVCAAIRDAQCAHTRFATAAVSTASGVRTVRYIITDGMPDDLHELEVLAALAAEGKAAHPHLILLRPNGMTPPTTTVSVTVHDPSRPAGPDLVPSLLSGCFPKASPLAERVSLS